MKARVPGRARELRQKQRMPRCSSQQRFARGARRLAIVRDSAPELARLRVRKSAQPHTSGRRQERRAFFEERDFVEVETPAVLTIQTGINEPRYATLRAIKQAEQQEIEVIEPAGLGEPSARVRRMFVPPKGEGAEMLGDDPAEVAQRIKQIVEERMR